MKKCQKIFQAQTGNLLEVDSDRLFCKAERGKRRGQFHRVVGLSFFCGCWQAEVDARLTTYSSMGDRLGRFSLK